MLVCQYHLSSVAYNCGRLGNEVMIHLFLFHSRFQTPCIEEIHHLNPPPPTSNLTATNAPSYPHKPPAHSTLTHSHLSIAYSSHHSPAESAQYSEHSQSSSDLHNSCFS